MSSAQLSVAQKLQAAQVKAARSDAAKNDRAISKSTFSLSGSFEADSALTSVRVDALSVMKIVKHARQQTANYTPAGQLLGLDASGVLDVSDAYPFPPNCLFPLAEWTAEDGRDRDFYRKKEETFDSAAANAAAYTAAFLPRLAEINADANVVGFYTTAVNGQITGANGGLIEALARYQLGSQDTAVTSKSRVVQKIVQDKKGPGHGVALVYDAASSTAGTVSIRAFRLTEAYLKVYQAGRYDSQSLGENQSLPTNILREYPVTITRSSLLTAFLSSLAAPSSPSTASLLSAPSFSGLTLPSTAPGSQASLSLPLQALLTSFESSVNAIGNLRYRDRRGGGKATSQDSHLDAIRSLAAADGAAGSLAESAGVTLLRVQGARAATEV